MEKSNFDNYKRGNNAIYSTLLETATLSNLFWIEEFNGYICIDTKLDFITKLVNNYYVTVYLYIFYKCELYDSYFGIFIPILTQY